MKDYAASTATSTNAGSGTWRHCYCCGQFRTVGSNIWDVLYLISTSPWLQRWSVFKSFTGLGATGLSVAEVSCEWCSGPCSCWCALVVLPPSGWSRVVHLLATTFWLSCKIRPLCPILPQNTSGSRFGRRLPPMSFWGSGRVEEIQPEGFGTRRNKSTCSRLAPCRFGNLAAVLPIRGRNIIYHHGY